MKITLQKVKEIVKEELATAATVKKSSDLETRKKIVNSSIDLFKAIESFEDKATEQQ
jgi:hypothetical protein